MVLIRLRQLGHKKCGSGKQKRDKDGVDKLRIKYFDNKSEFDALIEEKEY